MIRLALSLAAVFSLIHLAGTVDVLSEVTRPLVVGVLQAVGVQAADQQDALKVGRLVVPWTRDCAGLNVLAMLWAVVLWTNRAQPSSGRLAVQLLLAVPVAFVANLARILTLIAYRAAFFPAVESPQLHYFIGFLWVMPSLGLWVPWRGERRPGRYLEVLYLAAVLALLAPHVGGPGGSVAALATLVTLAHSRFDPSLSATRLAGGAAWGLAGAFIASAGMESLWIAWMLACPWFATVGLLRSCSRLALLAGTVPLVAMHPIWRVSVLAAAGWEAWRLAGVTASPGPNARSDSATEPRWRLAMAAGIAAAIVLPFVVSAAGGRVARLEPPPPGTMARRIDPTSYTVRLVGQAPDVELAWFTSAGDGRHHTLPVCLRYRGVMLEPSSEEGVMTDGDRWMREFFVQDGALLSDYPTYLRRTFLPFASPGVHIVVAAPVASMSAALFAQTADTLARQLGQLAHGER
jgi:exosortase/archaeosortase family protein